MRITNEVRGDVCGAFLGLPIQAEPSSSLCVCAEVEAKVGALSAQVADMAARMLEARELRCATARKSTCKSQTCSWQQVEGNLDFVRENDLPAGQAGNQPSLSPMKFNTAQSAGSVEGWHA